MNIETSTNEPILLSMDLIDETIDNLQLKRALRAVIRNVSSKPREAIVSLEVIEDVVHERPNSVRNLGSKGISLINEYIESQKTDIL